MRKRLRKPVCFIMAVCLCAGVQFGHAMGSEEDIVIIEETEQTIPQGSIPDTVSEEGVFIEELIEEIAPVQTETYQTETVTEVTEAAQTEAENEYATEVESDMLTTEEEASENEITIEELEMNEEVTELPETAIAEKSGTCGEDLLWEVDEAGCLKITGTGEMTNWASAEETPWWEFSREITEVVIEEGVTSIGTYAFSGCENMENTDIPESVKTVGSFAFAKCAGLSEVTIG